MTSLTVAGLQKTSLIDYPGRVSCVVFLTGCNFRCPYCHNPELALGRYPARIALAELSAFLAKRLTLLDGVVITGGEPTLHAELPVLCRHIRDMGLAVKLDTNGTHPQMLEELIREGLLDYVAMDLKTALDTYHPSWCPAGSGASVRQSIQVIMSSGVDYEFRTTCAPGFVDESLMARMAVAIRGARRYFLQNFNPAIMLDPDYCHMRSCRQLSTKEMNALAEIAAPLVASCSVR